MSSHRENRLTFRVDASATIGTGHAMRCLTLADELRKLGAEITFISRHLPAYLQEWIESKGHRVVRIGGGVPDQPCEGLAHAHFLGTSQTQDAAETRAILEKLCAAWLVIDHYAIDRQWESAMRPFVKKILVIDDLADRDHDCDLLVDQNAYADMGTRYDGLIPENAETLLGPRYAMLRPEFHEAHQQAKARKGKARRIFVFFGGMDNANYTAPVLYAIQGLALAELEIDVVIGAEHPAEDEIQRICQAQGYRCHVQTKEMAKLLLQADLAIGAGGSTSWERCCVGLPTLAYVVAPNQDALTRHADHLGLLKAGIADIHNSGALLKEIRYFIEADDERGHMSQACLNAVDAQGTQRIAARMQAADLRLRAATLDDDRLLFDWRNHPAIRKVSGNSAPIAWETHERWFHAVMQDSDRIVYIAELQDRPIGVIRFDVEPPDAEVSLYLAPNQTGRGLGTKLLLRGEAQLLHDRPEVTQFIARVMDDNEASHKLFRRCGYAYKGSQCYFKNIQV